MKPETIRWVMLGHGPFGRAVLKVATAQGWAPVGVMTHPSDSDLGGDSVRTVAEGARIPTTDADPNGAGYEWLTDHEPDVIFTVNYPRILNARVLAVPTRAGFNIHDSLLPTLRGRSPLTWAIILGHETTGVTVQRLSERVDEGDIVDQREIPIADADTSATIQARMIALYPDMVARSLRDLARGSLSPRPQTGVPSYGARRNPEDGEIDWTWSARAIHNWVRALTKPYPGAFTHLGDQRIMVWRCTATPLGKRVSRPGTVVGVQYCTGQSWHWAVACADGLVSIDAAEAPVRVGSVLGPH